MPAPFDYRAGGPYAHTSKMLDLLDNKPHECLRAIIGKELTHIRNYDPTEYSAEDMLLILAFTVYKLSKELDLIHERLTRLEAREGIDHTGQRK